ncbi:EF-hand domain-containing protein [Streptomyces griseorubiginosus]|uniref:EF-hand domain-containing protein n=1 Tax=Streptomyces griseorubiginosus TaxID=67304 RepID=UPI0036ECC71F
MSTGLIIALIVIVAAVLVVAAVLTLRGRGPQHGRGLKRRFGPEYDRAVARHDGDEKAAERELTERVERHGSLREQPLEPARRQQYEERWTAAQERFVDSPREAVAEADRLLAELAKDRGFPDGGQYEEQFAALSVHHAHHVHGYRRVHTLAGARVNADRDGDGRVNTEELREAMVEARALFEDLVGPPQRREESRTPTDESQVRAGQPRDGRENSRGHLPWAFNRRHAKGS